MRVTMRCCAGEGAQVQHSELACVIVARRVTLVVIAQRVSMCCACVEMLLNYSCVDTLFYQLHLISVRNFFIVEFCLALHDTRSGTACMRITNLM